MRLSSFRIRRFKSIKDTGECRLSADNILVLAGQNEAGKSAVIEALNFFRNGASPDFERLHRRKTEHPEVVCTFTLEDADIEAVFDASQNEALKKYLTNNPELAFTRGSVQKDNFEHIRFDNETAFRLGKLFPAAVTQPSAETQSNSGTGTSEDATVPTVAAPPKDVPGATVAPEGAPSSETAAESAPPESPVPEATPSKDAVPAIGGASQLRRFLVGRMPGFIVFESFSDVLPGELTVAQIREHPAVLDFQKIFQVDFAYIVKLDTRGIQREEQRINAQASDDLNTYWKQKIEDQSKYNFVVNINVTDPRETASTIAFMVDRDDGDPLFMDQKSKGFRWFSAFNLRLRALGIEEDEIRNLVLLIDEPGQGLHEEAQRNVKSVIEELAAKGAKIIYTTHHPNLIGTQGSEFARIRLVSNTKTAGTKVETVAQFSSRSDIAATDTLAPLVRAMGISSVGTLIDQTRCNVVVEGITDHYYLSAFRTLLNKSAQLFFIPACGVNNVPNLVSTLIGWGLHYKAVFDDDAASGRVAYNLLKKQFYENNDKLAHEHIYKMTGCNGIEDIFTVADFHTLVLGQAIPDPPPKANSRVAAGRKETLARLFLEKVENGADIALSSESAQKIEQVFAWLYDKFNL